MMMILIVIRTIRTKSMIMNDDDKMDGTHAICLTEWCYH